MQITRKEILKSFSYKEAFERYTANELLFRLDNAEFHVDERGIVTARFVIYTYQKLQSNEKYFVGDLKPEFIPAKRVGFSMVAGVDAGKNQLNVMIGNNGEVWLRPNADITTDTVYFYGAVSYKI